MTILYARDRGRQGANPDGEAQKQSFGMAAHVTSDMPIPWRARGVSDAVDWCMRDFKAMFSTVPCRKQDVLTVYVLLQYNVSPSGEQPAVLDPVTGHPDQDLMLLVSQTQNVYNRWFPHILGAFNKVQARRKLHKELGDGYARAGRRAYDQNYAFMSERASAWRHDPFKCMPARLAMWTCLRVLREYLLRRGMSNAGAECDDVCAALLQQAHSQQVCVAWVAARYAYRRQILAGIVASSDPNQRVLSDSAVLSMMARILMQDLDENIKPFNPHRPPPAITG